MAVPVISELARRVSKRLQVISPAMAVLFLGSIFSAFAQQSFVVSANIQIESGDTWIQANTKYRLYGVQSCLRGTEFKTASDTYDCGLVSLAQFAALTQIATITCQPVAPANDGAIFVICATKLAGVTVNIPNATIDVGTALIASGYAFAAVDRKGAPVNANYLVSELVSKKNRSGLWAGEFVHPVQYLLNGAKP